MSISAIWRRKWSRRWIVSSASQREKDTFGRRRLARPLFARICADIPEQTGCCSGPVSDCFCPPALQHSQERSGECNCGRVRPVRRSRHLRMHYEWEHAVAAGNDPGEGNHLAVTKRTGDDLCAELALAPDVIKIDVEGHEVKVIKGLMETLRDGPTAGVSRAASAPASSRKETDLDELFATFDTRLATRRRGSAAEACPRRRFPA